MIKIILILHTLINQKIKDVQDKTPGCAGEIAEKHQRTGLNKAPGEFPR